MMELSYLVASMGRSASSLLFRKLYESSEKGGFIRDLDNKPIKEGKSYKTHDFAPESLPEHTRSLFLFRDPVEVCLSVYYQIKPYEKIGDNVPHYKNLHANTDKSYWDEDFLRLEEQFDSWCGKHSYPVMALKYPDFFKHQRQIDDYLGMHIDLSLDQVEDWEEKIEDDKLERLEATHSRLREKISSHPSIKVYN